MSRAPEPGPDAEYAAWSRVVDEHIELVWTWSRQAGLGDAEAAVVSQLIWLRLAQQWPTMYLRLDDEAARRAVADWIAATVEDEAWAWARRHHEPGAGRTIASTSGLLPDRGAAGPQNQD